MIAIRQITNFRHELKMPGAFWVRTVVESQPIEPSWSRDLRYSLLDITVMKG